MADYKDILAGTFGKLAGRVKDAAEGSGVAGVYARGADRAKAFGQITRLTLSQRGARGAQAHLRGDRQALF